MATDRLGPGDADQMRDFADRCRRVARTARRVAAAQTVEAATLMGDVEAAAQSLRVALLTAAHHADPHEEDEPDAT